MFAFFIICLGRLKKIEHHNKAIIHTHTFCISVSRIAHAIETQNRYTCRYTETDARGRCRTFTTGTCDVRTVSSSLVTCFGFERCFLLGHHKSISVDALTSTGKVRFWCAFKPILRDRGVKGFWLCSEPLASILATFRKDVTLKDMQQLSETRQIVIWAFICRSDPHNSRVLCILPFSVTTYLNSLSEDFLLDSSIEMQLKCPC